MRDVPTLVPTDLWFRTVLVILVVSAVLAWMAIYHVDVLADRSTLNFLAIGFGGFVIVTVFDFYIRMGYKVSLDDTAVYWRGAGISRSPERRVVMPLTEITEVFSVPGTLGAKPFEAAILRAGGGDIPDIVLSRMYLRDNDIRDILARVSQAPGVVLAPEIQDFL